MAYSESRSLRRVLHGPKVTIFVYTASSKKPMRSAQTHTHRVEEGRHSLTNAPFSQRRLRIVIGGFMAAMDLWVALEVVRPPTNYGDGAVYRYLQRSKFGGEVAQLFWLAHDRQAAKFPAP
jgi:hypothetical protein